MTIGEAVDEFIKSGSRAWRRPSWWNLLIVLPWTLGLVLQIYEWRIDTQVAARQRTADGLITDHQPSNHNTNGYVFTVNGKSYTGRQSPGANELAIGKQVTVYYDPRNPAKNALTDFHDLSTASLGPIPLLLFGIGGVGLFIWYRRRKTIGGT